MDVDQARRMVQDKSEWWGFVRVNVWGIVWGNEPLTLMRWYSYMKPVKGGSPLLAKLII